MKKEKVVFKEGSFVDFTNLERQVIFAAISRETRSNVFPWEDWTDTNYESVKSVSLGVSVQCPTDQPDLKLGRTIAEGKARKRKTRIGNLFSTQKGFLNAEVIDALLEQELKFFKQNPGKYLKGYDKDKALYEKNPEEYYTKLSKRV